jgi:hypothetical protein
MASAVVTEGYAIYIYIDAHIHYKKQAVHDIFAPVALFHPLWKTK